VAQLTLQRLGYAVDVVSDGAQALAALASGSYDAVFMDCQLPVMDGFAATQGCACARPPAAAADLSS
jgi:CheY-like chemotaxis protein